jgi:putative transposase
LSPEDQEKFRTSFLPIEERTIQKDGIHFEGRTYYSDKLYGLRLKDNNGRSCKYLIRYDPFDLRYIYVLDTKENSYYRLPSREPSSEPITLRGWKRERKQFSRKGIHDPSEAIVLDQYRKRQAHLQNAVLLTKKARKEAELAKRGEEIQKRFSKPYSQMAEPHQEIIHDYEPPPKDLRRKIRVTFDVTDSPEVPT